MEPITATRNALMPEDVERSPSVRWILASLSLSMLMPSLDTSIANASLPALAQAFTASFQDPLVELDNKPTSA